MTVQELIDLLKQEDPSRIVIMSSDGEGNSHSPLYQISTAAYRADSTWSGEIGLESLTPADVIDGYIEEDVIDDGVPCVVLSPTN